MTPTELSPSTEQDVAGLVAFASEMARYFENRPTGGEDAAHWSNVANAETSRKIATALSTLAAERDEARAKAKTAVEEAHTAVLSMIFMPGVRAALDGLPADDPVEPYIARVKSLEASEARATALEGERDALKNTMRLHAGDTISLDNDARTANEEAGYWMAEALADRAQLARAREAMNAGLAYLTGNMDGDWNGEGDPVELLREALRSPAPADGRGDQMLASASCPQEPDGWKLVPVEPTEEMEKASALRHSCPCGRRITQWGVNAWGGMLAAAPPAGSGLNLADATPTPDLPSEARADGVKVKELEWKEAEPDWWESYESALRLGYEVHRRPNGTTRYRFAGAERYETFDGAIEGAKAAAQADFEARIRSALTVPPSTAQTGDA